MEKGLIVGVNINNQSFETEMIELKDHPFYVATQAHPEFKSRPDAPHPLFAGLIEKALEITGRDDYESDESK